MATTTPEAIRRGLLLVAGDALADLQDAVRRVDPANVRDLLLVAGPAVMDHYATGSSSLATDWYEELREAANPSRPHIITPAPWQRGEEFARSLVWATKPLELDSPDMAEALSRLGSAVEYETFDAFSGSMDANVTADREALGWSRNANYGACKFCQMLAARGAVYRKESSAHFAAHTNCRCTYRPEFRGGDHGPEASAIQYQASKRRTTAKDRERVRAYLNENYPDAPG